MNPTIWSGPDRVYIITTDQGKFKVQAQRLDYKETIKAYYKKGYTNVHITCLGRSV